MTPDRSPDAGLSLIEVLVSLAIFAIIGVAGLAVLDTISRTTERTEGRLERLADIDRAFLVIRRDLAQITPAPVTLDAGGLEFSRARGTGAVGVGYALDETTLSRRIATSRGEPVQQRLLPDVSSLRWRVMDSAGRWHTSWPPDTVDDRATPRPFAAEVTLDLALAPNPLAQTVTRLVVLPAGQGR